LSEIYLINDSKNIKNKNLNILNDYKIVNNFLQ
jgi:hypothetical protein